MQRCDQHARTRALAAALLVTVGLTPARAADELESHLATLRRQVENRSLDVEKREQIALEMAATLDRAAQTDTIASERRKRWTEAINLLDRFERDNPGHTQSFSFRFQTAIYIWARGRLWADQWDLAPNDDEARTSAVENLNAAIARFRTLNETLRETDRVLSQNVRFRLAQALTDRARLEPEDSDERRSFLRDAADILAKPIDEPTLRGFASLLRADVLGKLGEEAEANLALDAAEKSSPPVAPESLLEARVGILLVGKRYEQALKAITESTVGPVGKAFLNVKVRLAERSQLGPGDERSRVETALFDAALTLRGSPSTEARLGLLELGRTIREPDKTQAPDAWDVLAEAAMGRGDLARASVLDAKGADRAEALDQTEKAAALRLRAGASLFRAERFLEADAMLGRVADNPQAGESRVKAGMLRILARARALATKTPGASQTAYVAALESQIRDFPKDESANEARWLLGKVRLLGSKKEEAESLWSAIPRSDRRWLDARLAIARLRQEALDSQRISNDRELVRQRYNEARNFLSASLSQCQGDAERAAINLAMVELELTPDVGNPEEARRLCESIQRSASQADQRDRARRFHLVALAELNHYLEAEQEARAEVKLSGPSDLLELARVLDRVASESSSDIRVRRVGLILRVIVARILERQDELSRSAMGEAKLRQTRALLFIGDEARARASVTSDWGNPPSLDDRILKDMADTYVRLNAFELAAEVQRLRLRQAATGSPAWFESRYGLALANYRAGQSQDASKLIDATSILHPDLGGGELREKFIHLRERLNPEP